MSTPPLSRYELLEKIGAGGMGEVFLARDTTLERQVALKFLPEALQQDAGARARFLREAKSAAALDHPFVCKIYEIGEESTGSEGGDGRSFIAMEYVQGETLAERLRGGPLGLDVALRLASEIAEALETAHGQGIVHRDLKPANIMVTESDHVKVLDFGLAKRVESPQATGSELETEAQITGAGVMMGTPAYMSPEQMRAETVDRRSDIFSFGVVLYEMLTGAHPFTKGTAIDTAGAILNLPTPPVSGQHQEIPELLDHVVGKMTAKSPDERYQQVREVRIDLNRIREPSGEALTTGAQARGQPGAAPRRLLGVGAVASLALLAAGAWWIGLSGSGEPQSVAVLPLHNVGEDGGLLDETEYIAQGISRAVATRLTQAGLRVTPWETAFRYADSDDPQGVARELNVDAVLTGTLQMVDDRLFVTLSMVDADSGLQSWADTFEEPSFEDIFRVNERIAVGAAESLMGRLTGEQQAILATAESDSVDAWDAYMSGSFALQQQTGADTEVALQWFDRAVALDEDLAEAHVGLGAALEQRYYYFGGTDEDLTRAQASFEADLELDESSMEARRGLILVHFYRDELVAIARLGRDAERLGRPDDVEALLTRAMAYDFGLDATDLALPLYREVMRIDPANPEVRFRYVVASWPIDGSGAAEAAREQFRLFGDEPEIHRFVAFHHHIRGETELALQHYESALGLGGAGGDPSRDTLDLFLFAGMLFEQLGDSARAEQIWRQGKELAEQMLSSATGNALLDLRLAALHTVLGEDESALELERDSLAARNPVTWELMVLATAHAEQGRTDHAVELLRLLPPENFWLSILQSLFKMADVQLPVTEEFEQLVEEAEQEQQRLLEQYGPRNEADRRR